MYLELDSKDLRTLIEGFDLSGNVCFVSVHPGSQPQPHPVYGTLGDPNLQLSMGSLIDEAAAAQQRNLAMVSWYTVAQAFLRTIDYNILISEFFPGAISVTLCIKSNSLQLR